ERAEEIGVMDVGARRALEAGARARGEARGVVEETGGDDAVFGGREEVHERRARERERLRRVGLHAGHGEGACGGERSRVRGEGGAREVLSKGRVPAAQREPRPDERGPLDGEGGADASGLRG